MKIEYLNHENIEEWNNFIYTSKDSWLSFLWESIQMDILTRSGVNLSFLVREGKQILAAVPLLLRKYKIKFINIKQIVSSGTSGIAFNNELTYKQRKKLEKVIFKNIDILAKNFSAKRTYLMFTPLSENRLNKISMPPYLKFGYSDVSFPTRIIDLNLSEKKLWHGVRRQYRSLINTGKREGLKFVEYDKVDKELLKNIYNLYTKMCEKTGYDIFSFDIFLKRKELLIDKGYEKIFTVERDDKIIGALFLKLFKNTAHYSSGIDDPDHYRLNISHFMQWNAIKWLKDKEYKYYSIGWQQYIQQYSFPSKKEQNISFFKRGFGGFDVPLFCGEKYYGKIFYLLISMKRMIKYINYIE